MKFSDIIKYTEPGHYETTISFEYLKDWIVDHQRERGTAKLELNPDFQRGHVWTKEQQIKYVEYKLSGGTGANVIYFNCVGWMNKFEGPFVLVDGLQRVTAVLAFMNGEIPAFGHYIDEYEDRHFLLKIDFKFNINNLKTRKEVLKWYIEMNTGGVVHSIEEIDRVKKLLDNEG